MIAYQKEKIENAICFFAFEHQKATKQPLYQIFLYKYLAFLDFECLRSIGRPSLGLKYLAMERGPVPIDIYNQRDSYKSDCFKFKKVDENKYIIEPQGRPDLAYFSPYEVSQMRRLIEIFADRFVRSNEMSEASHEEIRAWRRAWRRGKNSIIQFEDEFDEKISVKNPKDLSPAEEAFLIYKGVEQTSN
jgi:uncharacterized phage-associated protein